MREMDLPGLKICSYQAELFEASVNSTGCSSKIFIRRFMNSELAGRMDSIGFLFDSLDIPDALAELDAQYGTSTYGIEKFSAEEMHWIGYIYRYWAYTHELSSRQLYREIKPDKLRKLYFPYHSLDPLQAIERIREELEPGAEVEDDIARGVAVYRKVLKRRSEQVALFAATREEYKP